MLTRDGVEYIGTYQAGDKPYFSRQERCGRCGGAGGSDKWKFTGWTCFECGGSGKGSIREIRLYTQEQLDKLNATQAKKDARKAEKAAAVAAAKEVELELRRADFMSLNGEYLKATASALVLDLFAQDVIASAYAKLILSDRMREVLDQKMARLAANAELKPLGVAGERRVFTGTVERVIDLESYGPWAAPSIYIVKTVDGGIVKYKGTGCLGAKGEDVTFKATVDGHEEYNGVMQTLVSCSKVA